MDSTAKMQELLQRLKRQMNGAVSGAMEQGGVCYGINYGVSLPTIKQIASAYAPDNDLARLLIQQDVRELRLSAAYIFDPQSIAESDIEPLSRWITNNEVAEIFAFVLLRRSAIASRVVSLWSNSENNHLKHCAYMIDRHLNRANDTV